MQKPVGSPTGFCCLLAFPSSGGRPLAAPFRGSTRVAGDRVFGNLASGNPSVTHYVRDSSPTRGAERSFILNYGITARGRVSLPKRTLFGTLREPYCPVKQKRDGRIITTRQKNEPPARIYFESPPVSGGLSQRNRAKHSKLLALGGIHFRRGRPHLAPYGSLHVVISVFEPQLNIPYALHSSLNLFLSMRPKAQTKKEIQRNFTRTKFQYSRG